MNYDPLKNWNYVASMPSDGTECFWIEDSRGFGFASVDGPQGEIQEKAACLIHAAPDLFNSAIEVLKWWDEFVPTQAQNELIESAEWNQFQELRKAVKKAKEISE